VEITFRHDIGEAGNVVLGDEYTDAYEEIYAEPPYNSNPLYGRQRYLARTAQQVSAVGFDAVSAIDQDGQAVAGFAFGFRMGKGRWWGGETTTAPSEVLDVEKFAVIELILRKPYRGHGVGKRLLNELIAGRPEPYATLLSHPQAEAHNMYERWGWRVVGTCTPAPDAPTLDMMLIKLS
jgi:GNAT superfamily N-acetyltransferase